MPALSEPVRAPGDRPGAPSAGFAAQLESVHLQWFAAEDEGRTEDPTEHKLREARKEGKVAKSQDVTSAVMLLLGIATLALLSGFLWNTFLEMVTYFYRRVGETDPTSDFALVRAFFHYLVWLTAPVALVCFVAAAVGNLAQVGFLFTTKPLTPDPKRVAPNVGKWVKRSVGSAEAGFNLAKSLGKIVLVGVVSIVNVAMRIDRVAMMARQPVQLSVGLLAELVLAIVLQVAVLFLILSYFDYLFQKHQHKEQLKMTRHEVKEERKTQEGDPMIKNRLQQRMQEVLSKDMIHKVPEADVVITNPTHYAVAMEYDRLTMVAPTITAKGVDNMAQRIREIAHDNDVPIIENRPLARALYADVELGDVIPERYYEAVVTVLKQVYLMKGVRP